MQITTTPGIDGRRITKYCGVVAGEAIMGANLFKDLFAGVRERILLARVPKPLQDTAIGLVTAGLLSLTFFAFKGMV